MKGRGCAREEPAKGRPNPFQVMQRGHCNSFWQVSQEQQDVLSHCSAGHFFCHAEKSDLMKSDKGAFSPKGVADLDSEGAEANSSI